MGSEESKPSPPAFSPTPPSLTFTDPWRKASWGNNQNDLDYVNEYQPELGVNHLRVLVYGPVNTGKSSFITSVSNTLRRRMTHAGEANALASVDSFTKKYETHKIKKEGRNFYPFVFNDVMGLEEKTGRGVCPEDIKLVMMGHVKEGYTFNPVSPLSSRDQYYNPSPSPDDKVHVLVCVHSGNAAELQEPIVKKMKEIREAARDLGIPQIAVVTKVDEACPETEKNLRNVYKSKYIKKKMEDFSSKLGIPMKNIFPVNNYHQEYAIDDDIDTLILRVLRQILDFGDDYIDKMFDES